MGLAARYAHAGLLGSLHAATSPPPTEPFPPPLRFPLSSPTGALVSWGTHYNRLRPYRRTGASGTN